MHHTAESRFSAVEVDILLTPFSRGQTAVNGSIGSAEGHCVVLHSRWEEPKVAAAIIGAGPEPLQSQFATGYNMAANLLRTRSLAEARAFIERSFGNYLGECPAHHDCYSCTTSCNLP